MVKSISPTIEGGLLVAITVILGLVTVFVPIIGIFFDFFFAVPLAVLTVRHGAAKGLLALFVTFVLLSMLISPLFSLRVTLNVGICGVVLGQGVRKNFSAVRIFFTTFMIASASQFFSLVFLSLLTGVDVIAEQEKMMRGAFTVYAAMGVEKNLLEQALQMVMLLIPTLLMLTALLNTVMIWLASKWIFVKLQIKMPSLPPFVAWKFPVLFFYLAAFGGLGIYWGTTRGWTEINLISTNLLFGSLALGFIQSMSCFFFLAERFKLTNFFRVMLFVMVFINPFMWQITAMMGLIDMLVDYREILRKRDEETRNDE